MTEIDLRAAARQLQQAALTAVDPAEAVYKFVSRVGDQLLVVDRSYPLREFKQVFLIGAGKAAAAMARAPPPGASIATSGWAATRSRHWPK